MSLDEKWERGDLNANEAQRFGFKGRGRLSVFSWALSCWFGDETPSPSSSPGWGALALPSPAPLICSHRTLCIHRALLIRRKLHFTQSPDGNQGGAEQCPKSCKHTHRCLGCRAAGHSPSGKETLTTGCRRPEIGCPSFCCLPAWLPNPAVFVPPKVTEYLRVSGGPKFTVIQFR